MDFIKALIPATANIVLSVSALHAAHHLFKVNCVLT